MIAVSVRPPSGDESIAPVTILDAEGRIVRIVSAEEFRSTRRSGRHPRNAASKSAPPRMVRPLFDRRLTKGKGDECDSASDRLGRTDRAGGSRDVSVCIDEQSDDHTVSVHDNVDAGLGSLVQAGMVDRPRAKRRHANSRLHHERIWRGRPAATSPGAGPGRFGLRRRPADRLGSRRSRRIRTCVFRDPTSSRSRPLSRFCVGLFSPASQDRNRCAMRKA